MLVYIQHSKVTQACIFIVRSVLEVMQRVQTSANEYHHQVTSSNINIARTRCPLWTRWPAWRSPNHGFQTPSACCSSMECVRCSLTSTFDCRPLLNSCFRSNWRRDHRPTPSISAKDKKITTIQPVNQSISSCVPQDNSSDEKQ